MRLHTRDTLTARKACGHLVLIFVPPNESLETEEFGGSGEVTLVWRDQRLVADTREVERAANLVHSGVTRG